MVRLEIESATGVWQAFGSHRPCQAGVLGMEGKYLAHEMSCPAIASITSSRTVAFQRPVSRTQ